MRSGSFLAVLLLSTSLAGAAETDLPLIPTPKSIRQQSGSLVIAAGSRVLYSDSTLEPLAKVFAADLRRVHGAELAVAKGRKPGKGDILLKLGKRDAAAGQFDRYRVTVADGATVEGGDYGAVAAGAMTLLQAARGEGGGLTIPCMTVEDHGDRGFRALQVDIRAGYHSPEWVKHVIDGMRFYKVRMLELHTTEQLWVGAAMESSNGADTNLLRRNSAWSKREMDGVMDYARERGVALFPHNEMRPNDPFWPPTLTTDFNTNDTLAGFVDEVDGKGKFEIKGNLAGDERFWNFVKAATQRSYAQYARSWPDGKMPYYHIGPVYGEGGCNGKEAVRMLGYLREKNPDIRMMYWNGPGNNDPDMTPNRDNLAVCFYSATWGGTPEGLLANGYPLVNTSWTPLYILPGTRFKAVKQGKWIFDEFQLSRFGSEATFGEPIAKARDCSQWETNVIGAMLPTWDFPSPTHGEGHLEMITPCIPFFAEHLWNVRPYPYPAGAWERANAAYERLAPLLNRLIREDRPASAPGAVTATCGTLPNAVDVLWAESDNYPTGYRVLRATTPEPTNAVAISGEIPATFVTQLNRIRDDKVEAGKKYYYWVQSLSQSGESALGRPVEGFTGTNTALPVAWEPFDAPAGTALEGLGSGSGFIAPWKVNETNVPPPAVASEGLTYPGLKVSGRALHIEATDADETNRRRPPATRAERTLTGSYGEDGTQIWYSFLIRPQRVAIGDLFVYIGRTGVGKGWGNGICVYGERGGGNYEDGKTYFLVLRYTFQRGTDLIHMWVNPTPGRQPADTEAAVITRNYDNPPNNRFSVTLAPYGKGSYDVDELRVGPSYENVAPAAQ